MPAALRSHRRKCYRVFLLDDVLSSQNDRVAERRQVRHPIEVDVTVGVIDFVLENAGCEAVDLDVDRLAFVIESAETQRLVTRDFAAEEGDAEAAFPVGDRFASGALRCPTARDTSRKTA